MKKSLQSLLIGLAVSQSVGTALAQTVTTGPSSSQSPYALPIASGYSVTSLLTVGNSIGGYTMVGLPDGLGAYDNNDGTFTVLMNHEFGSASVGAIHASGSAGSFVSKWVINKNTLTVMSGADLTSTVNLWNPTSSTYSAYSAANPTTTAGFGRFCSADLAAVSAFYNDYTGKGTQSRIFLNGEETGDNGRMMAHIATGPEAGMTFELPFLGKFSCENQVANPRRSDKTIVAGFDDTTPGQVYIYVGNKMAAGNAITRAGLTNGLLYGVTVSGAMFEGQVLNIAAGTAFSLTPVGAIQNMTGTNQQTLSASLGITQFLRPEDGAWDPSNPSDLYFNTTNAFNSPTRVWRLRFTDIENPQLGGTITAVLDGTEGGQMFDNMGIDNMGHIFLNEDVGGNAYLGRVLRYDIATDVLTPILQHDADRFITGAPNFLTQDEEASGIVDVQPILGAGKFIFVTQAHYGIPSPIIEGGQLELLNSASIAAAIPEVNVQGNATNISAGTGTVSPTNNTNFGMVNAGTSLTKTFLIQNTGTGTLTVTSIVVSGVNAGDFSLVNPPSYPWNIAPGAAQTITVNFNTPIVGVRNATINVVNNDLDEDFYNFAVQATAASYEINVQGNSVNIPDGTAVTSTTDNTNLGQVMSGVAVTKVYSIQNTGNGTLTVSGITMSGANAAEFTMVTPPAFPIVLAGASSQTFIVQFMPTVVGTRTAMVNISSNDADESAYDFKVEGEGTINTGIKEASSTLSFVNLFPNPAKDEAILSITLDKSENVSVKIYDVLGKQVIAITGKELVSGENQITINTSDLKNGAYFVQVEAGLKTNKIKMLVKH